MAVIGGPNLTTAQLLGQVQSAIAENLNLPRPTPILLPGRRGEGETRRPANPFLVGVDPEVASGPPVVAAPQPPQSKSCGCKRQLDNARCMETLVNEWTAPVVEPGVDILPRRAQRISLYVGVFAGSPLLLRALAFHAADSAFKLLAVGESITLTLEDYGPLVFEPWNAIGQAGGSAIVVSETFVR